MKAVILAGGLGSRLSEETVIRPKPLVEIGGRPILWHILKIYSAFGVNDFIICLGYKGFMIKEYFSNYALHMSDVTIDVGGGRVEVHENTAEPWRITLVDTGDESGTGGRLKRVLPYVADEKYFHFTYGDGVGDIDIDKLTAFHRSHGRMATVTAARPPHRFGVLHLDGDRVKAFEEKPEEHGGWVNAGFFVLTPEVGEMIDGDDAYWERAPAERIVARDQMRAFFHRGFWQPMDTLRDKETLERLWAGGFAPWKVW